MFLELLTESTKVMEQKNLIVDNLLLSPCVLSPHPFLISLFLTHLSSCCIGVSYNSHSGTGIEKEKYHHHHHYPSSLLCSLFYREWNQEGEDNERIQCVASFLSPTFLFPILVPLQPCSSCDAAQERRKEREGEREMERERGREQEKLDKLPFPPLIISSEVEI